MRLVWPRCRDKRAELQSPFAKERKGNNDSAMYICERASVWSPGIHIQLSPIFCVSKSRRFNVHFLASSGGGSLLRSRAFLQSFAITIFYLYYCITFTLLRTIHLRRNIYCVLHGNPILHKQRTLPLLFGTPLTSPLVSFFSPLAERNSKLLARSWLGREQIFEGRQRAEVPA